MGAGVTKSVGSTRVREQRCQRRWPGEPAETKKFIVEPTVVTIAIVGRGVACSRGIWRPHARQDRQNIGSASLLCENQDRMQSATQPTC